jgi:hypothetical protein
MLLACSSRATCTCAHNAVEYAAWNVFSRPVKPAKENRSHHDSIWCSSQFLGDGSDYDTYSGQLGTVCVVCASPLLTRHLIDPKRKPEHGF